MNLKETKEFLIGLALRGYNEQFQTKYKTSDFDVVSIRHKLYKYSFEVFTKRDDDSLRLRMYLEPGAKTSIGLFRMYEHEQGWIGTGDEVFVTYGNLGSDFFAYCNNSIRRLVDLSSTDYQNMAVALLEDGTPLLLEDNSYLHLEIATAGGLYPTGYYGG